MQKPTKNQPVNETYKSFDLWQSRFFPNLLNSEETLTIEERAIKNANQDFQEILISRLKKK